MEYCSPNMWDTSVIFKYVTAQNKQPPIARKFAQFWSPSRQALENIKYYIFTTKSFFSTLLRKQFIHPPPPPPNVLAMAGYIHRCLKTSQSRNELT
jgi:hypothetical protein